VHQVIYILYIYIMHYTHSCCISWRMCLSCLKLQQSWISDLLLQQSNAERSQNNYDTMYLPLSVCISVHIIFVHGLKLMVIEVEICKTRCAEWHGVTSQKIVFCHSHCCENLKFHVSYLVLICLFRTLA
jgi:hypothetical protein